MTADENPLPVEGSTPKVPSSLWMNDPKLELLGKLLDVGTKMAIAFGLLAYAVGIVIVGFRLQMYGLRTFDLLRTEYIVTGLLWEVITVFAFVCWWTWLDDLRALYVSWRERPKKRKRPLWRSLLEVIFFAPLLYWWALSIAAHEHLIKLPPNPQFMAVLVGAFSSAITLHFSWQKIWPVVKSMNFSWPGVLAISHGVLLIVVSVSSYAVGVYPNLSPVFGGAKTRKLDVIISPTHTEAIRLFGVDPHQRVWGPLEVVLEDGEAFYVVQPDFKHAAIKRFRDQTVIRIPKNFGQLIRFHPQEY